MKVGDRDVQPGERIVPGARLGRLRLVTLSGPTEVPATGRLTHLQFRRFAGCPVCDLHLRSFVRRHDEIERAGITEIVFFHSRESELRAHAAGLPFLLVADPARRWYARFRVGASRRALLDPRAWFYVVLGVARSLLRVVCGRQPMPPLVPEGGSLGLPADFLIGSDGAVLACNYGEHVYDQWSVADLLRLGARVDEAAADRGSSMR
jgi:hypothetical protein